MMTGRRQIIKTHLPVIKAIWRAGDVGDLSLLVLLDLTGPEKADHGALAQRCAACASLTGGGAVLCVQGADEFEPDRMTEDHRSDLNISCALLYPIAILIMSE